MSDQAQGQNGCSEDFEIKPIKECCKCAAYRELMLDKDRQLQEMRTALLRWVTNAEVYSVSDNKLLGRAKP